MAEHRTSKNSSHVKRLYLAESDRKLAGVCGGIAEYFEIDSTVVRLAWIILTIMSGVLPGVIAYILAAVVVPKEPVMEGAALHAKHA